MKRRNKILIAAAAVCVATFAALAQNSSIFPTRPVTISDLFVASNYAATTLLTGITSTSTSLTVASGTGFAAPGLYSIDNEIVDVCQVSGNTLTIGKSACPNVDGRGYDGTQAVSHSAARPVQGRVVAWMHNQVSAELIAIEAAIGYATSDRAYSTLSGACSAAASAGNTLYVTKAAWDLNGSCTAPILFMQGGSVKPTSGHTATIAQFSAASGVSGFLDVTGGGSIASSVTIPQTIQSQWFKASDYGARVAAAAKLLANGGGTVDGQTGEGDSPPVISNGEDVFGGCSKVLGCGILFLNNPTSSTTRVNLSGLAGAAHSQGAIVLRDNMSILGGSFFVNNGVNGNSQNKAIDIQGYTDSTETYNVTTKNVNVDGNESAVTGPTCAAGSGHNHIFNSTGVVNLQVSNVTFVNACGDGIYLGSNGSANTWSTGSIHDFTINDSVRDDITVNAVQDFHIYNGSMTCDDSNCADFIHAEPNSNTQPVLRVEVNSVTTSGPGLISIEGYDATDRLSYYQEARIHDNLMVGGGRMQVALMPFSDVHNNTIRNPAANAGLSIETHDIRVIGNEVSFDSTPPDSTNTGTIEFECTPSWVPSAGLGNITAVGNKINNGVWVGFRIVGCNNSVFSGNSVHGLCASSNTDALGYPIASDGVNANTGINILMQGNTAESSTVCSNAFTVAASDGSYGLVDFEGNIFKNATQRYRINSAGLSVIHDTFLPFTLSTLPGHQAGNYPAAGSQVFCSDCKNAQTNSAAFGSTVTGSGAGTLANVEVNNTDFRVN